jgi:hypothetical protein
MQADSAIVSLARSDPFNGDELSEFLELEALAAGESDAAPPPIRPLPESVLLTASVFLSWGTTTDEEDSRGQPAAPVLLDNPFSSDSYQERSDGEAALPAPTGRGLWECRNGARHGSDSESDSVSEFFKGDL